MAVNIKKIFHEQMESLEAYLEHYKKCSPNSFGELFRSALPILMVLFGVLMIVDLFSGKEDMGIISQCYIAPVLIFFGVVLLCKGSTSFSDFRVATSDKLDRLIMSSEVQFGDYPDVMEYIKQLKAVVAAEKKRKKRIIVIFWCLFCAVIAAYIIKIVIDFTTHSGGVAAQ
ncbi:MAG: hypothetical protein J6T96_10555 [Bacteroidales bacterium]|nr:hypothetical protein [Bacteroidales bacterium]